METDIQKPELKIHELNIRITDIDTVQIAIARAEQKAITMKLAKLNKEDTKRRNRLQAQLTRLSVFIQRSEEVSSTLKEIRDTLLLS